MASILICITVRSAVIRNGLLNVKKGGNLKKVLIVAFLLSLVFSDSAFARKEGVTVCTFPMAPYTFKDSQGHLDGLEVDLVNALLNEAGFRTEFINYPWNRAIQMLEHGKLDMLMTMTKTPEREKFTHFLGVSTHQKYVLFVKKENAGINIRTLDDLMKDGYLFGIRQHFHYSDEFNSRLASDKHFQKHFKAVAQADLNLRQVKGGRLTGCFGDSILTGYQVKTDKTFEDLTAVNVPFFQTHPVYFGVSRKISPDKLEKLQRAYLSLEKKGVFNKIIRQWL